MQFIMASDAAPDAVAGKRASLSDKLKDGFGNHVTKIATVQFMLCALQSMARAVSPAASLRRAAELYGCALVKHSN